jgi:hypothetical protein
MSARERSRKTIHSSAHEDFREESVVTIERALRLVAGALVALSVVLGIYVNPMFLWFTVFVGLNLFQSAFTDWCPMRAMLRKAGLPAATTVPNLRK